MRINCMYRSLQIIALSGLLLSSLVARSAQAVSFDFNSNNGGFTSTLDGSAFDGPWVYGAAAGGGGSGGWSTDGQGPEIGHPNTTDLTSPLLVVSSTGDVLFSFDHRYSFEFDPNPWDGGAVFVSLNNGSFSEVPGESFSANGYNGSVVANSTSLLAGQPAFTSASPGYDAGDFVTSIANLGSFSAGDSIQVRFRAAYDSNTSYGTPDWAIDNVALTNIVPEPSTFALAAFAALGLLIAARRER
jgi:hypothetical protein